MYKSIKNFYKIMIFSLFVFFVFYMIYFLLIKLEEINEFEWLNYIIWFFFIVYFFIFIYLIFKEYKLKNKLPINEINYCLLKKILKANDNTLIVFDTSYRIVWTNNEKLLMDILKIKKSYKIYGTELKKIFLNEMSLIKTNKLINFKKTFQINKVNLFNVSQIKPYLILMKSFSHLKKSNKLLKEKEVHSFFLSIDEDVLFGVDSDKFNEKKKSIFVFLELELNLYFEKRGGIIQIFGPGEYILFINKDELKEIISYDFKFIKTLIEKIRKKFKIEITFSSGFYLQKEIELDPEENFENWKKQFLSLKDKYHMALKALTLAQKRGGDQIVCFYSDETFRVFGKQRKKSKITPEIKNLQSTFFKIISKYNDFLIVGHKNADFDSLGSGIAMKFLLETKLPKSKSTFLVREISKKTYKTMSEIICIKNYNKYVKSFFDYEKWIQKTEGKAIIVVDNNNIEYIDLPVEILEKLPIICIDHHNDLNQLKNVKFNLINTNFSSASEIIMLLLLYKFSNEMFNIPSFVYKSLLIGILLDTNNLQVNVNKNTVSVIDVIVQNNVNLQKQINILKYFKKIEVDISKEIFGFNVFKFNEKIVILFKKSKEPTPEEVAKIAEEYLLNYRTDTVFAIVGNKENIFVSARSQKEFNVEIICKELGGGGSKDRAASNIKNSNIDKVFNKIKELIKKNY